MKKHYSLMLVCMLLITCLPVYSQTVPPNGACKSVLNFDGTNDYIDVPDGVYFDDNTFTIEAWVYIRNFNNWERIIDFGNGAANNNIVFSVNGNNGTTNTHLSLAFVATSGSENIYSSATLSTNTWTHVAAVLDGTSVKLYINGTLEGSYTTSVTVDNINRTTNYIGRSNWGDPYFNGLMDEVRIWSVARTDSEIEDFYDVQLAGTETNLLAYWDMNDMEGSIAEDKTANSFDGTLTNMDLAEVWVTDDGTQAVTVNLTQPNEFICAGEVVLDAGNAGMTYLWSDNSTAQTLSLNSPAQNVTYSVRVTDADGCFGTSSVHLNRIRPIPTINAGSDASVPCGQTATLNAVSTVSGYGSDTLKFHNTTVVSIPDNNLTGVTSTIEVSGCTFNANDIIAVVLGSVTHTFNADLDFTLFAPDGSSIDLCSDNGGSGDNITNLILSASASTLVSTVTNSTSNFTGQYAPEGSFSSLAGSSNGTWTLKIVDDANADVGTLNSWSLYFPGDNSIQSYSWSPSTGLSDDDIYNPVVTPPSNATAYTVTVADEHGCSASDEINITSNCVAGIENAQTTAQLAEIYPNPTQGIFSVEIAEQSNATIFNAGGGVIYSGVLQTGIKSFDLSNEEKGIYMVKIQQKDQVQVIKVLVE